MALATSRRTPVGVALTIGLVLAAGCSSEQGEGGESGTRGKATILLGADFDSLDPALASGPAARQITSFLYDPLVHYSDETGEVSSGLAESWTFSTTSAELVLRDDVTCTDGTEFTADTVKRNLERAKDPDVNAPLTSNFLGTLDYEVKADVDNRTVTIELAEPNPFLARGLSLGPLMVCDAGLDDPDSLASTAHGTGPYMVEKIVPNESYTLTPREGYAWGPDGATTSEAELPAQVEFRLVGDENTAANLLLSGDADAANFGPQVLKRLEAESVTLIADLPFTHFLNYNERSGHVTSHQAVRLALAQSIDREQFTTIEGQGLGTVATTLRAPDAVCSDPAATKDLMPAFDTSAAASGLESLGWARNSEGVWERDGQPLEITLLKMGTSDAATEYLRDAWTQFGINVTVDTTPESQANGVLFAAEAWDVAIVSISAATPTGIDFFVNGPPSPTGSNYSAIDNADYAAAAKAAMSESGDASCQHWVDGEIALLENVDLTPLASIGSSWALTDLEFNVQNSSIQPLSLHVG